MSDEEKRWPFDGLPVAVAYGVILGMDKKEKNIKDEI